MRSAHDLGNDGQACCLTSLQQKLKTLGTQALEIVWRCTGLEGATTQDLGTRCLYRCGDGKNLLLALYGTRTCHDGKVSATNLDLVLTLAHLDYCIIGVEATVRTLEGITDACNAVNYLKTCKQVDIYLSGISDEADDSLHLTLRDVHTHVLRLEPMDKIILLSLCYSVF